jgi:hypothetical protein
MLKSFSLLLSFFIFISSASADVTPMNLLSDYKVITCVNPVGDDMNDYPFVMYVKRYRDDGLFTFLQFNDGTFSIKELSISSGNLILEFSAARAGQMSNDQRLQERLVVNPKTASAVRIQDVNGKISQNYSYCKMFQSEDHAPMIKWIKNLQIKSKN